MRDTDVDAVKDVTIRHHEPHTAEVDDVRVRRS